MAVTGKTDLTHDEWDALVYAETPIYSGIEGVYAYTDVNVQAEAHPLLGAMWAQADEYVCQDDDLDSAEQTDEIARRVAIANAILAFGAEFVQAEILKATV